MVEQSPCPWTFFPAIVSISKNFHLTAILLLKQSPRDVTVIMTHLCSYLTVNQTEAKTNQTLISDRASRRETLFLITSAKLLLAQSKDSWVKLYTKAGCSLQDGVGNVTNVSQRHTEYPLPHINCYWKVSLTQGEQTNFTVVLRVQRQIASR